MLVNGQNSSLDSSNLTDWLHPQSCCLPQFLILIKIILPFLLIGAVGNFLTVTFLISTSEKKTPMNLLLLNQTVADFILSSLVYPSQVIAALSGQTSNGATTKIFACLFMSCQASVFISILFISLNRVLAIVYYKRFSVLVRRWLSLAGILLSWIIPLLFLIPIIVGWVPGVSFRPGSLYPMGMARNVINQSIIKST
jgi:7 transmembrane receptor (rhodopsin family)